LTRIIFFIKVLDVVIILKIKKHEKQDDKRIKTPICIKKNQKEGGGRSFLKVWG